MCFPHRWVLCALCSLAFAILQYKNACFMTIISIVEDVKELKTKPVGGCPFFYANSSWDMRELPFSLPDFFWADGIPDLANSAFYIGRMLPSVPAGMLADLGYSRCLIGIGMLLVVVRYLLLPSICNMGAPVYVFLNFVEGVGEAFIVPSIFTVLAIYNPPLKRNFYVATAVSGVYYGRALGYIVFKLIYRGFKSWSFGHRITGSVTLLWLVSWLVYTYFKPVEDPIIQRRRTLTSTSRKRTCLRREIRKLQNIPWRKMFSSGPLISLVLAYCSLDMMAYLLFSRNLDSYQEYVLHLPAEFARIATVSMLAVLPPLLLGGWFADWIVNHDVMSKTNVNKSFASFGVVLSSTLQACVVPISGCNIQLFWVLGVISMYMAGLAVPVLHSTPIDLHPRYAGLFMGIMTCAVNVCALLNDIMHDILVTDSFSMSQWQNQFLFVSTVALFCVVPYMFFGSAERQRWTTRSRTNQHASRIEL